MPYSFKGQSKTKQADEYRQEFAAILNFSPNDMDLEVEKPLLHSAVINDLPEGIKALVSYQGTNINLPDKNLSTPLHIACGLKNLPIIQQLLLKNASLEYQNSENKTPFDLLSIDEDKELLERILFFAAEHGRLNVVQALKKRGISLNCFNEEGQTLSHIVCKFKKFPIIKWMISENLAEFDILNREQQKPLQLLSLETDRIFLESLLSEACAKDRQKLVNTLLDLEVNPNCVDDGGRTPLHHAANAGSVNVISQLLVNKKIDFYKKTRLNSSILHTAAYNHHPEIVKLLIKKDVEIAEFVSRYIDNNDILNDNIAVESLSKQNYCASRLLEIALNEYRRQSNNTGPINKEALKVFVVKGMLINSLDCDGQTPLMSALEQSQPDHAKLNDIVDLFLNEKYFNAEDEIPNRRDKNNDLYLHSLVKHRIPLYIVNKFILLYRKNSPIVNEMNSNGMTPLHLTLNYREMIPTLMQNGAKPEIQGKEGMTFLHLIAKDNNNLDALNEFIRCLDQSTVKQEMTKLIKIKNAMGRNVIHIAAEYSELILLLLLDYIEENEKRAILNDKDSILQPGAFRSKGGDTPLHLALRNGKFKNFVYLSDHGANHDITNGAAQTVSASIRPREIANEIKKARQEIAHNKTKNTEPKPRSSSFSSPSLITAALSSPPLPIRASTGSLERVVPGNGSGSLSTPSSGRSVVSTQQLLDQQHLLANRKKRGIFDDLDNLFKHVAGWIGKTAIGQHLSRHQKKYIVGTLAIYYIGFGALCIMSIFFPPISATIPIYFGVGKALGALHLAASVVPIVAKVITFLLPVIAPHILGVGAAVIVGAYKLFGEFVPNICSYVNNLISANPNKIIDTSYNVVAQNQDNDLSTQHSEYLPSVATLEQTELDLLQSDSTSCLNGWVKSLSKNFGQPFCAFFSSIAGIFDEEDQPEKQQDDTPQYARSEQQTI